MIEEYILDHKFSELEKIHHLKMQDTHFSRLVKNYHTVNKEVNCIKFGVESTSAAYLE
jgi:uncharacterized protein YdcH (DUF465 family)